MPLENTPNWRQDFAEIDEAQRRFELAQARQAEFGDDDAGITRTETPDYLVPDPDRPIKDAAHFRSITLLGEPAGGDAKRTLETPLDVMAKVAEVGATEPVIAVRLTHEQAWRLKGSALGSLHHSLSLAPGEVTQIAMVERKREVRARTANAAEEIERVRRESQRQRQVSEIVESAQRETQFGSSLAFSKSSSSEAGASGIAGLMGLSGGTSSNSSTALQINTSGGSRRVSARASEDVRQATQESVAAARSERSTLVQEVSEELSEEFRTRVVANYNHMHALNMQYYEVVQVHELAARVTDAERCLFIPMKLLSFDDAVIKRYKRPLAAAARSIGAIALGAALDLIDMDDKQGRRQALVLERSARQSERAAMEIELKGLDKHLERELPQPGDDFVLTPGLRFDETILREMKNMRIHVENLLNLDAAQAAADERLKDENLFATMRRVRSVSPEQIARETIGDPQARQRDLPRVRRQWAEFRGAFTDRIAPLLLRRVDDLANQRALQQKRRTRKTLVERRLEAVSAQLAGLVDEIEDLDLALQKVDLNAIQAELAERSLYFNQAIWVQMDANAVGALIGGRSFQGENLAQTLDPQPIGVFGNLVGFRWRFGPRAEDDLADAVDGATQRENAFRARFLDEQGAIRGANVLDRVAVPTGGLFAEAVLGQANCSEKVDLSRFWKWDENTIPIRPTAIRKLSQKKREAAQLSDPEGLGEPSVKLSPRQSFPDRPGADALQGLLAASAFRDMSGLENIGELLEAGTKHAAEGAHAEAEHAQKAFSAQLDHLEKVLPIIAELAIKAETGGMDPSSLGGLANALGGFSGGGGGGAGSDGAGGNASTGQGGAAKAAGASSGGGGGGFDISSMIGAAKKGGLL